MMDSDANDSLVLGTVNAPYRRLIDGATLAECVRTGNADEWVVHVATFFGDVRPELVVGFAERHGIGLEALGRAYRRIRDTTGERSPRLEALLADMERSSGDHGVARAG